MANLKTLDGISEAREDLYEKTLSGTIPDTRANVLDRILRGQVYLKGDLPLKFIKLASQLRKVDDGENNGTTLDILQRLEGFLGGNVEQKQIA